MNTLELLKKYTEVSGISGNEKNVSNLLKAEYEKMCDEVIYDNLGSIFGVKKSAKKNAPKVMIAGHMDEAGFIVRELLDNGLVKCLGLGKHHKNALLGAEIKLETRTGKVFPGTIVSLDDKGTVLNDEGDVLIDLGAESKEELLSLGLTFGDSASFKRDMSVSPNGNRIFAKAINGRYGCVLGLELLDAVKGEELDFDLYVGATVQEEVGLRGAQTATQMIKPDLAVCLDTLDALENKVEFDKQGFLGKGMLITYYDKVMLPNRKLVSDLKEICKENDILSQHYFSMGDSDAGWIHKLVLGTPTLFGNIPVRNINTSSSVMDIRDYNAAKESLTIFIKGLNPESIQGYKEENR
ncbi:M42 family metallopeptidase [Vagococcus coleopterorum]|uniref:M42 family metallopeptidase n=1 Tax=Vagococcus coleopterorum TaxID=2714946 RepID=A0A6G8ANU4_9ENTE|nr:M42 family metallopeptidase [Vagococcus coleopterorum]QIL46748.1 M42 family metallopeptidase [Vagococcus coleopterorum]